MDKKRLQPFLTADGKLRQIPARQKVRMLAMQWIMGAFEENKRYTESEVNGLINQQTCFQDPATIRRELYNHHFLDREANGNAYWMHEPQPTDQELGIDQ